MGENGRLVNIKDDLVLEESPSLNRTRKPGSNSDCSRDSMKESISIIYPQIGLCSEAEIFSKTTPLISVGHGAQEGYNAGASLWVKLELEVVLGSNSRGKNVGVTRGNDVNDRVRKYRARVYSAH